MATPFNKYGMPNGSYAQAAQARTKNQSDQANATNPIGAALRPGEDPTPGPTQYGVAADGAAAVPGGTTVTAQGKPNLAFQAPPSISGRYSNGDSDVNDASQILTNAYHTYLNRDPEAGVINGHLHNQGWGGDPSGVIGSFGLNSILQSIYNSPEANTYRTAQSAPPPPEANKPPADAHDVQSLVMKALTDAKSTDDPSYWINKVSSDPNGTGSAWQYWLGRINQGDGAEGVRNGTVQKFNDGPSSQHTNAQKFSVDPSSVMTALASGQNMTPSYTQQLLAQIKQSLALQNALK
jgi:hypothetical protein